MPVRCSDEYCDAVWQCDVVVIEKNGEFAARRGQADIPRAGDAAHAAAKDAYRSGRMRAGQMERAGIIDDKAFDVRIRLGIHRFQRVVDILRTRMGGNDGGDQRRQDGPKIPDGAAPQDL